MAKLLGGGALDITKPQARSAVRSSLITMLRKAHVWSDWAISELRNVVTAMPRT